MSSYGRFVWVGLTAHALKTIYISKVFFLAQARIFFFLYIYIKESELVSGFFTEHSSIIFIFFFLAEYASIILISVLTTILFLGGYSYPFD